MTSVPLKGLHSIIVRIRLNTNLGSMNIGTMYKLWNTGYGMILEARKGALLHFHSGIPRSQLAGHHFPPFLTFFFLPPSHSFPSLILPSIFPSDLSNSRIPISSLQRMRKLQLMLTKENPHSPTHLQTKADRA